MIRDQRLDAVIAAVALFTTEPTDRALAGWSAHEYLDVELDALEELV